MSAILLENITGVRVVRAFNNEEREEKRMGAAFSDYAQTSIKANRRFANLDGLSFLFINMFVIIVYWLSGGRISAESLNLELRTQIAHKLNRLPLRFYDRNMAGEILSRVTSDLDKIAEVLQDTWLFGGTIAENIAYGKPDASREEIIAAAKAAKVDYFTVYGARQYY